MWVIDRTRTTYNATVAIENCDHVATQAIVRMFCEGMPRQEIAANLDISERQLLRRLNVAKEDGESALDSVLHSLQACDEDRGSHVVLIDAS